MTTSADGPIGMIDDRAHHEHQSFVAWKHKVVQKLLAADLDEETTKVAERLAQAFSGGPALDSNNVGAMEQMVSLVDLGIKRCLGVKGHLLASIARAYPEEHELLYKTLRDGSCLLPSPNRLFSQARSK